MLPDPAGNPKERTELRRLAAPTQVWGRNAEWHGSELPVPSFLARFPWSPVADSSLCIYLYVRAYQTRDLWIEGREALRVMDGSIVEYFVLELEPIRPDAALLYRLVQRGGSDCYASSQRCNSTAQMSRVPASVKSALESKGVRRRDLRRFSYPLAEGEWMHFIGAANEISGRDKDG